MRAALLSTTALVVLAFAGCASPGASQTAQAIAPSFDDEAAAWADDAVLVGLIGFEVANVNGTAASFAGENNPFASLQNMTDPNPGDGETNSWGAVYASESRQQIVVLTSGSNGILQAFNESEDIPVGLSGMLREARDRWTIDSDEAMRSLRAANATLDAAFGGPEPVSVVYALFLLNGWTLTGNVGGTTFEAQVDQQDGKVLSLEVRKGPPLPIGPLPPTPPTPRAPPPPPIHEEGDTAFSADPLNMAGAPPCTTPSAMCEEIPFTLTQSQDVEMTLSWGLDASDYDFYVVDASGTVVLQGASPPGTVGPPETAAGTLEAGTYTVQVVPWSVVQDSWTFDATFS